MSKKISAAREVLSGTGESQRMEAIVFRLMNLLDLRFTAAHVRTKATGVIEARMTFDCEQPVFSRWQVRCKKTELLTVDDVAIEVGLTYLLKSNVIVMISAGSIEGTARLYADKVMRTSNLCIMMLDGTDLDGISTDPLHIKQVLAQQDLMWLTKQALVSGHCKQLFSRR